MRHCATVAWGRQARRHTVDCQQRRLVNNLVWYALILLKFNNNAMKFMRRQVDWASSLPHFSSLPPHSISLSFSLTFLCSLHFHLLQVSLGYELSQLSQFPFDIYRDKLKPSAAKVCFDFIFDFSWLSSLCTVLYAINSKLSLSIFGMTGLYMIVYI